MSVRVADRNQSRMEYIHNAQQIVFIIQERTNKYIKLVDKNNKRYKQLAKQAQHSIWNAPLYHSQLVYNYCQMANKTRDSYTRLNLLESASQNLDLLESSIETFYHSFRQVIKDKFIILVTEKIDFERTLLKGCVEKFRNVG